ncbi:MAG: hypothetical protein OEY49_11540, partial [Candidatus Heimdallarchaeota archaeon]|nr:hypothetical protein [Candidatus Heimdallarchaeota archaeon]
YKTNPDKIGLFQPVSRFLNLMIAFLGVSSSIASIANLKPESPVSSFGSMLVWGLLILLIPLVLTPVIPVIWAMEDLGLKAWNDKMKTNWTVASKYKNRFNQFIAIGTLSVGYTLSGSYQQFLLLLFNGFLLLTYPIAVLTLLYYIFFQGTITREVQKKMDVPIAETRLIYYDFHGQLKDSVENTSIPAGGSTPITISTGGEEIVSTDEIETEETEASVVGKVINKTGQTITNTGKAISSGFSTLGSKFKKKEKRRSSKTNNKNSETKDRDLKREERKERLQNKEQGGSATDGLWKKEPKSENTSKSDKNTAPKKKKGGSSTEGLWDKEES